MNGKSVNVILKNSLLYKWHNKGNISLISNSFSEKYFDYFSFPIGRGIGRYLKRIPFHFSTIIQTEQFLFAAVDRVRSFPLFYKLEQNSIILTDSIQSVEANYIFDSSSVEYFKTNLCCQGNKTLLMNWHQIFPGEYLLLNKISGELFTERYYSFTPLTPLEKPDSKKMKKIYLDVFAGLLDSANGKTIIIPLSGGYDSRSIVSVLTELQAKNIFTYTYGKKDGSEKYIAERIAKKLNLNWHFVEYNPALLNEFFKESWEAFSSQNHHFTSLPVEQDFFALTSLKRAGLLPEEGVVFSGYLGDCLGGSMFKNRYVKEEKLKYQDDFLSNFESKYTLNAVHLYEYFGLEWRAPFVTPAILDAWFSISLEDRCFKNGYNDFLRNTFFLPLDIDFLKRDHYYHSGFLKNLIKETFPKFAFDIIKKKRANPFFDDPFNFGYLAQKLIEKLEGGIQDNLTFNELHARYFLKNLTGSLLSSKEINVRPA